MARVRRSSNKNDSASRKGNGQIRIIAGQWRGRRLPVACVEGLRPTTDRVRETLFNWLMNDIDGARILDCFSGSGALGLEALSRYASHATLLELNKDAARQLQKNLADLNVDHAEVIHGDSLSYLAKSASQSFDVVFLDPPFRQDLYDRSIAALEANGYLAEQCWIYVESEAELAQLEVPSTWLLHREKKSGQVLSRLYRRG
ncbi:16S rRNA (guanine(966)-N(2))-methyltransferase RsmD [Ferrimonas lipolytica]|uniref:Ribosomal RNA small subunit methyltransferase D n=1 Tax=Ferrimonas lipolytica TaxID=2724191 RepID=A0A6H1UHZ2_9GAMM|nr:16S rRNA (guanine(966)-N(2))-methyltransferase RsmD [Ferrimonas lipolytica]QIZ78249.1 16S rRNA (guanine(966)-N(2))-methyltransferase RsmD [Ferrimonas lipolytica]